MLTNKLIQRRSGFTIVELLIVIVVIAILAAISIVAYNGIQGRARDSSKMQRVNDIAKALEMYRIDNGDYPHIQDGNGDESTCGSQTENWGHCDRNKILADSLAAYIKIDPTSLSGATQSNFGFYYTSQPGDSWQTYGMKVNLEGAGGVSDGGYMSNAYEVGPKPRYCMGKYTGTNASWVNYNTVCNGGN